MLPGWSKKRDPYHTSTLLISFSSSISNGVKMWPFLNVADRHSLVLTAQSAVGNYPLGHYHTGCLIRLWLQSFQLSVLWTGIFGGFYHSFGFEVKHTSRFPSITGRPWGPAYDCVPQCEEAWFRKRKEYLKCWPHEPFHRVKARSHGGVARGAYLYKQIWTSLCIMLSSP